MSEYSRPGHQVLLVRELFEVAKCAHHNEVQTEVTKVHLLQLLNSGNQPSDADGKLGSHYFGYFSYFSHFGYLGYEHQRTYRGKAFYFKKLLG